MWDVKINRKCKERVPQKNKIKSTWTQLDVDKSNEMPKHNGTKEKSRTPSKGLQAISDKPFAMSDFFTWIHRCRI